MNKNKDMKEIEASDIQSKIEKLEAKKEKYEKKNEHANRPVYKIIDATIPYVIATAVSFGVFSSLNVTPFFKNTVKEKARIMKEMDTEGNEHSYEQYEDYSEYLLSKSATISQYGKWTEDQDGSFVRKIKVYNAEEIDQKDITIENLKSMKEGLLDVLLGEPLVERLERKDSLTDEEKNQDSYLKATVYYEDENKFIIKKEESSTNNLTTLAFILSALWVGALFEKLIDLLESDAKEKRNKKIFGLDCDIELLMRKQEEEKKLKK